LKPRQRDLAPVLRRPVEPAAAKRTWPTALDLSAALAPAILRMAALELIPTGNGNYSADSRSVAGRQVHAKVFSCLATLRSAERWT